MAKFKGAVIVDVERCKGCNLCVIACPQDVLLLNNEANTKGYNYSYMEEPDACTGCTACATICPDACITVYRAKVPDELAPKRVVKKLTSAFFKEEGKTTFK